MTQREFDLLRLYDALPPALQNALAFVFQMSSVINSPNKGDVKK